MGKKKNKRNFNPNQQSFFFEDYLSTNQKFRKEKNFIIDDDRLYILFFSFFFNFNFFIKDSFSFISNLLMKTMIISIISIL